MISERVGITFGAFDLCHPGHVLLFDFCKQHCDRLIVGLHVDPTLERPTKNKPVMSLLERQIILKSNKNIDEIICYETEKDIEVILKTFKLDVRFLGYDYFNTDFTGKHVCEYKRIKLMYCDRSHGFSTTSLRQRIERSNNR